jgi:hypothetical protein
MGTMASGHPQSDHQTPRDRPLRTRPHRTTPASFTRTASAGPPAPTKNQHSSTPETPSGVCLSRMPRRVARTDLRGPRCSNASGLPDGAAWPQRTDLPMCVRSCQLRGWIRRPDYGRESLRS